MGLWKGLLQDEFDLRQSIAFENDAESAVTLFDQFKPNPGGQARFFEQFPLESIEPSEVRHLLLCGGIGCIAGETEINGVSVRELTRSPVKVQTLMGEMWATPAYLKGQANIYRVTLRSGKQVLVTAHHRMLGKAGWVRLENLRVGDVLACDDTKYAGHSLENTTGYRSHCWSDLHPYGELLPPFLVDALDKLHQSCVLLFGNGLSISPHHRYTERCSLLWAVRTLWRRYQPLLIASELWNAVRAKTLRFARSILRAGCDPELHQVACDFLFDILCDENRIPAWLAPFLRSHRQSLAPQPFAFESDIANKLFQFQHKEPSAAHLSPESSHALLMPYKPDERLSLSAEQQFQPWGNQAIAKSQQSFHTALSPLDSASLPSAFSLNELPLYVSSYWDVIEAIEYVRYDDFYDLHVPSANHYKAHGIWHHNSGKSYCGAAWAISRALLAPDARGMIVANSYGQLARSSLTTLVEVCQQFNVPLEPMASSVEDTALAIANRQRCYIGPDRSFVYVLSMNAFMGGTQAARGLQIRWVWGDELSFASEKAFQTLDGRLGRGPGDLKGQGLITTTPNGFNWIYSRFADPNRDERLQRLYVMFNVPTRENIAELGDDYVSSLETNYTDELAAQELEGAFINTVTGRAYKYFDRSRHALSGEDAEVIAYDPLLDLHVSFDFNYSPAVCVLAQQRGREVHFFKEFYVIDSDTFELASLLCDWIDEAGHLSTIHLYGDASGAARSAVSRSTNWDLVFDAFRDIGYTFMRGNLQRHIPKANPPVVNRINSCNCLFRTDRVFVNLAEAPELCKDWEMVSFGAEGIDKSDPMRTHPSDAAGYLLHTLYPYKRASEEVRRDRRIKGIAA